MNVLVELNNYLPDKAAYMAITLGQQLQINPYFSNEPDKWETWLSFSIAIRTAKHRSYLLLGLQDSQSMHFPLESTFA